MNNQKTLKVTTYGTLNHKGQEYATVFKAGDDVPVMVIGDDMYVKLTPVTSIKHHSEPKNSGQVEKRIREFKENQ